MALSRGDRVRYVSAMSEGTKDYPWQLTTAPGTSRYTMYRDGDELRAGYRGRFGMYLPPLLE